MKHIHTESAPKAIGPYSQAVETASLLFVSGQGGIDPETGKAVTGLEAQAELTMQNIGAILRAAGSGYDKAVKTTCFLADMSDFAVFNTVYERYFTGKPARSCVAVKQLPLGLLCEVEVIAENA